MEDSGTDVRTIRRRVLNVIAEQPHDSAGDGDNACFVRVLNDLLATELVGVQRYKTHLAFAERLNAALAASLFLSHADEGTGSATLIADQIRQLGGEPKLNITLGTSRPLSAHDSFELLEAMVCENLAEEHVASDIYRHVIMWLDEVDLTSRDMVTHRDLMARLASKALERADQLRELLIQVNYPAAPGAGAIDGVTHLIPLGNLEPVDAGKLAHSGG